MKTSQILIASLAAAAFATTAPAIAGASPRSACSVLSVAEVRAIVGAPVTIYRPGSPEPTVQGDSTYSTCTYTLSMPGKAARVMIMWGPSSSLSSMYKFYVKRHKELPQIKGDALVLASVTDSSHHGLAYDMPASQKLLDAAIRKL
jgi:hypothetical protein